MTEQDERVVGKSVWDDVPTNPDPESDLGYRLDDWEEVTARSHGDDHLLFLPNDEEMLRDDAFLVVDPSIVRDLASEI